MHTAKEDPEILVIGHVTKDKYEDQYRVGGAAYYGSVTAKKLGKNVCLVTSHADDFKFPKEMFGIDLINVPSPATTTFHNIYSPVSYTHLTLPTICSV